MELRCGQLIDKSKNKYENTRSTESQLFIKEYICHSIYSRLNVR